MVWTGHFTTSYFIYMKLRELRMNLFPSWESCISLLDLYPCPLSEFFFFAHEESIWASLPNLVHFISPHNSHETCALQLLKLGGSSRLLDFISYSLSLFSLNKALSRQYCITMKAQNGYVWSDRRSLSRYSRFMKHLGRYLCPSCGQFGLLEHFPSVSQPYNFTSIPRR